MKSGKIKEGNWSGNQLGSRINYKEILKKRYSLQDYVIKQLIKLYLLKYEVYVKVVLRIF